MKSKLENSVDQSQDFNSEDKPGTVYFWQKTFYLWFRIRINF